MQQPVQRAGTWALLAVLVLLTLGLTGGMLPRDAVATAEAGHVAGVGHAVAGGAVAGDEAPRLLPADEPPAKRPRDLAGVVCGKRAASAPQARIPIAIAALRIDARPAQPALPSPSEASGDRADPTRHLHPGRAPPAI